MKRFLISFVPSLLCFIALSKSADAACVAPSGWYGGTLPGLSYNSSGSTDGAFLQMMSINIIYTSTTKKFTATVYAMAVSANDTAVTSIGPISIGSSAISFNSTTCMGSFVVNGTTTYFVATGSAAKLMIMNPGTLSGSGIKWMNGVLEKI